MNLIKQLTAIGALRNMLNLLALFFVCVLPFTEPAWNPQGWDILLGAVVPAVAPMIVIILMLDSLMCAIWRSDSQAAQSKQHFTRIIHWQLGLAAILLTVWFLALQEALFR